MTKMAFALDDKEYESRIERGVRARLIREKVLELTREQIKQKYHVGISTLQGWEDVNYGGMNEKAAKKLAEICRHEGYSVSVEFIMYGVGASPLPTTAVPATTRDTNENHIVDELHLFYQHTQNATHFVVPDESAIPYLMVGDYVAGARYSDDNINDAIDKLCIVELFSHQTLLRIVKKSTQGNYTLLALNNDFQQYPLIENTRLFSAAPILWIRRPTAIASF